MAADGATLDDGCLLAKAIDGYQNFQDAEQFIASGGQKGPQVEILKPGTYRNLTASEGVGERGEAKPGIFSVQLYNAVVIGKNWVGPVEAFDGAPPNGFSDPWVKLLSRAWSAPPLRSCSCPKSVTHVSPHFCHPSPQTIPPFIAEDPGLITPDVSVLLDEFQVPGTCVLQFAFDGHTDNPYLPQN
jgi:hypothetical protein